MDTENKSKFSFTQKISFKLLIIFGLILILQIPLFLVKDVIRDRQSMQLQAQETISQRWGSNQTIGAPALIKTSYRHNEKGENIAVNNSKNATTANFQINLQAQKRYLGIFESRHLHR